MPNNEIIVIDARDAIDLAAFDDVDCTQEACDVYDAVREIIVEVHPHLNEVAVDALADGWTQLLIGLRG